MLSRSIGRGLRRVACFGGVIRLMACAHSEPVAPAKGGARRRVPVAAHVLIAPQGNAAESTARCELGTGLLRARQCRLIRVAPMSTISHSVNVVLRQ